MDPPECSGHSHDHEHAGDDLGLSLRPQIDLDGVTCLNEEVAGMGRSVLKLHEDRLSAEPVLRSQEDDPELLLYIPFTEAVTILSIAVRSVVGDGGERAAAPPRTVKLFPNRDDLDFDTARELQADATLQILPPDHFVEGTIDYPLRPAGRFQNISSLTMFFPDNYEQDDEVSTVVTFVGLKGKGTRQKRMAVEAVYESQGMPKDHKVPDGEYGMSAGFGAESEFE
jgi:PITH domain